MPQTPLEPIQSHEVSAGTRFVGSELVIDDSGYSVDAYVLAMIKNAGDAPSVTIELTVDWYDENGDYLTDSPHFLQILRPGETWKARIDYLGTDADKVDDYELDGDYDLEGPRPPTGATLLESEHSVGDYSVDITCRVKNERDRPIEYMEAIGTLYDTDGAVLGDDWTNENGIPAGETWRFNVSWPGSRMDAVADHRVTLDATL